MIVVTAYQKIIHVNENVHLDSILDIGEERVVII